MSYMARSSWPGTKSRTVMPSGHSGSGADSRSIRIRQKRRDQRSPGPRPLAFGVESPLTNPRMGIGSVASGVRRSRTACSSWRASAEPMPRRRHSGWTETWPRNSSSARGSTAARRPAPRPRLPADRRASCHWQGRRRRGRRGPPPQSCLRHRSRAGRWPRSGRTGVARRRRRARRTPSCISRSSLGPVSPGLPT